MEQYFQANKEDWDQKTVLHENAPFYAVEYCRGQYREDTQWVWLPMLQKALTACDDLNCAEIGAGL